MQCIHVGCHPKSKTKTLLLNLRNEKFPTEFSINNIFLLFSVGIKTNVKMNKSSLNQESRARVCKVKFVAQ